MRLLVAICTIFLFSQTGFAQEATKEDVKQHPLKFKEYLNLSYGPHTRHALDVYTPEDAEKAPILMMVHGGAWRFGDKSSKNFVAQKVRKWVQEGFIVVSVNYRLLPTLPYNQAQDIRHALTYVQGKAYKWGGDLDKVILLGHSAGAHLVGLVNANPQLSYNLGAKPWRGAILLDSAALDVVSLMKTSHTRIYDRAFGSKLYVWTKSSPYHQLKNDAKPMLLVCSSKRETSCPQAEAFKEHAQELGVGVEVLERALSHKQINTHLGKEGEYTEKVDAFIQELLGT